MRENLDNALELVFGHEGGFVNDPDDPGGPTKYGITLAVLAAHRGRKVTVADVAALGMPEAEAIYRKGYWHQVGGDELPSGLDFAVFDFGVNSGPATAVKVLQRLLARAGVYDGRIDGSPGPKTFAAVRAYNGGVIELILRYCDARMAYLRGIRKGGGWAKYGRGWTIRVLGKDPNGKYRQQPGVVGQSVKLAQNGIVEPATLVSVSTVGEAEPEPVPVGKAPPPDAPNPWFTPEALGPITAALSSVVALASDNPPLQWALAVCAVMAVGTGLYYVVTRKREVPL